MNKGFTIKEFLIAIITIGLVTLLSINIININNEDSSKKDIVEKAELYVKSLNTNIIESNSKGEDMLYKTYLPKNIDESVIFNIENISILTESKQDYKGIIKATYISKNEYKYEIAIYNGKYMIGTKNNLVDSKNININLVEEYIDFKFDN